MVRLSYLDIANSYQEVKQAACGRQACSVMILVAYEVSCQFGNFHSHQTQRLDIFSFDFLFSLFVQVDAMASCKMLTQLLRSDNIAYTIRPVLNVDEVIHTFQSFLTEDIKSIFMVNCGAVGL